MDFVRTYFNGEKAAGLLFIMAGAVAVLISLYCWINIKKSFYTGLAFPLLFLGAIQIAVATIVYLRSPRDTERILSYITLEPERIETEEIPRMTVVMQNFVHLRYVELGLIITGIVMMFFIPSSDLVKGIGVGLFIQASLMLAADYFAERRAEEYLINLRKKTPALHKQS